MSSRYWNSYYDRKVLDTLSVATAAALLVCDESEFDDLMSIQILESDWESKDEDDDINSHELFFCDAIVSWNCSVVKLQRLNHTTLYTLLLLATYLNEKLREK